MTKIEGIKAHFLPAGAEWQSKVHFKIVDSGRAAYLSRHLSDGSREFQFMDCTGVPRTGRRLVSEYLKKFEAGVALRPAIPRSALSISDDDARVAPMLTHANATPPRNALPWRDGCFGRPWPLRCLDEASV